jgi:hypothetical protein
MSVQFEFGEWVSDPVKDANVESTQGGRDPPWACKMSKRMSSTLMLIQLHYLLVQTQMQVNDPYNIGTWKCWPLCSKYAPGFSFPQICAL